ncbi:MAG: glycosyltransferase family 39 protein [Candidatus Bathyarchaeota archaeon]|nr:MAG: glycosyltransferase family 39 protein [Candidatus Bathyarchaeota archaeon]
MSRLREENNLARPPSLLERIRSMNQQVIVDLTIILAVSAIGYLIRVDKLNGYSSEDDAAYVAACGLIMQGYIPHRDFFLAHPPGFFFFVTLIWKLLGLKNPQTMWYVGKIVCFLSFIGVSAAIYLLCRNALKNRSAGLLGVFIYQLSSQSLLFSTACAPQIPATLLIIILVYLVLDPSPKTRWKLFTIGLLLGVAVITRLSSLYLLPIFFLYLIFKDQPEILEWRELAYLAVGLVLPIAAMIAIIPTDSLWFNLVLFHFLKGGTTMQAKIEKFLLTLTGRELPHLLGLISTPYILSKRDRRVNFLLGQSVLLLGPYFMQATPGAHLLVESSPLFAILTAVTISETVKSIFKKRRSLFTIGLSVLLLSTILIGLPRATTELSDVLQKTTLEGRIYRKLVDIVERETNEEDMVFSQIPVVPFLAGRDYPPFMDTSQSAKDAGIYTPDVVAYLVLNYNVKLLVVWYRTAEDLSSFLQTHGFVRIERLEGYWIYLRIEK